MKKQYLLIVLLFTASYGINAQVGINTTTPEGALDITSTTNGFVAPRVALVITTQEAPVTNPQGGTLANSTMVYNTATANDVYPGYYYWEDTRWIRLNSQPTILRFTSFRLPVFAGTNNNLNLLLAGTNYNANVFRLVHNGAEIGGITNGTHGRLLYIYNGNNTNKDLKLSSYLNATGTAAINRFGLENDIVLKPGNAISFFYDGLYLNRWVVVKGN